MAPPLKVFIASITANPEVRKRVQRVLMVLDGLNVEFDAVDITKPGNEEQRMFMREHAVRDDVKGNPLPPQFFYNQEYLGNFVDFEEAVEDDRIAQFLRVAVPNLESEPRPSNEDEKADKSDKKNENGVAGTHDEGEAEDEEDEEGEDEYEEGEDEDEEEGEEEDEEETTVEHKLTLPTPSDGEVKRKEEEKKEASAEVEETAVIRLDGTTAAKNSVSENSKVEEIDESEGLDEEEEEGEEEGEEEDEEYEEEEEVE